VEALSQNDLLRVVPSTPTPTAVPPVRHHLAAFAPTASLDEVVRAHVAAAIQACGGNRAAAARALGVGRNTLWRWIKGGRGACNRTGAADRKVAT
jgi:transcriptional regulator of acetoin/glycerol metabolism